LNCDPPTRTETGVCGGEENVFEVHFGVIESLKKMKMSESTEKT
jgi:hypothetical protein